MRKLLLLTLLLTGLSQATRGQTMPEIDLSGLPQPTTVQSLRYWFDNDANVVTTATLSGTTTIDASALTAGVHMVHYQAIDNKDIAGIPASKVFIKLDGQKKATAQSLRYWFDNDANVVTTTLSGATMIDASALVEGVHTLHYQTMDDKGHADIPVSSLFIKLGNRQVAEGATIRYWFDDYDTNVQQMVLSNLVQVVDASRLSLGTHALHYQLVTVSGEVTPVCSGSFENVMTILQGDVNGDRTVDIADAVCIVNHVVGKTTPTFVEADADVNGDGKVDIADAVKIMNMVVGKD